MPITVQLQLNESQLKDMTEYYLYSLKELKDQRKDLDKEIENTENIIQQLSRNKTPLQKETGAKLSAQLGIPEMNGFIPSWPIHEKISYILRTANSPKTSRQIFDKLLSIDPTMHSDKEKAIKNISTVLSIKNGELYERVKSDNGENVYKLK